MKKEKPKRLEQRILEQHGENINVEYDMTDPEQLKIYNENIKKQHEARLNVDEINKNIKELHAEAQKIDPKYMSWPQLKLGYGIGVEENKDIIEGLEKKIIDDKEKIRLLQTEIYELNKDIKKEENDEKKDKMIKLRDRLIKSKKDFKTEIDYIEHLEQTNKWLKISQTKQLQSNEDAKKIIDEQNKQINDMKTLMKKRGLDDKEYEQIIQEHEQNLKTQKLLKGHIKTQQLFEDSNKYKIVNEFLRLWKKYMYIQGEDNEN